MESATFIAIKKSFFITLIYVGLGTVSLLCLALKLPENDFINGLLTVILFLTIPVTCISFAIMYSSSNYGAVLIVQSIIFLLFWLIAFLILNRKIKSAKR
nr:hypothetical protein [Mucilaginibacter sp. FT3.2]